MAAVAALHAVTSGIAQFLTRAYQIRPIAGMTAKFAAVGTSDLQKLKDDDTTCSVFMYRVTHNEHLRNRVPAGRPVQLTVNLHLLFTIWADSPLREQSLLAWVLRELHQRPVLDRSVLAASGNFLPADQIQLTPEELTLEDMTKLWHVLVPPYRASIAYVARNAPIDLDPPETFPPVVATRFGIQDEVDA